MEVVGHDLVVIGVGADVAAAAAAAVGLFAKRRPLVFTDFEFSQQTWNKKYIFKNSVYFQYYVLRIEFLHLHTSEELSIY